MKKIISVVLVLTMVMVFFSFDVYADTTTRPEYIGKVTKSYNLSTDLTLYMRAMEFDPVIGQEIVNISGSPGIRVYQAETSVLVTIRIVNNTNYVKLLDPLYVDLYMTYATNYPNGYGIPRGLLSVTNYTDDLILTYNYTNGTSMTVMSSVDWTVDGLIAVPPNSQMIAITELKYGSYYQYDSNGYTAKYPNLDKIELYNTPTVYGTTKQPIGMQTGGGSSIDYTNTLTAISDFLDSIDDTSGNIYSSVDGVETLLTTIVNYLNAHGTDNDAIVSLLNTIISNVDGLEGYLDGVEGYIDGVEGYIDNIENLLTYINNHVDQLEGYLDQVEGYIDQVEGYIDGLEGQMTTNNNLLTNIKNLLTWTGNFPSVTYNSLRRSTFSGIIQENDKLTYNIERVYSGSRPVLDSTDFETPNNLYQNIFYKHSYVFYIEIGNNTGYDQTVNGSVALSHFITSDTFRGIEIKSFYSDVFTQPYLYITGAATNIYFYLDPSMPVLKAGKNRTIVYVDIFTTSSTAPSVIEPGVTSGATISSYSPDLTNESNQIGNKSDQIHVQEETWYNQNSQAMQSVGLSNYRYSTQQFNGILGVTFQFEQLWSALGSWTLVYIFVLMISLATFILRHRPTTKQQQRMVEATLRSDSAWSVRMMRDDLYAGTYRNLKNWRK